MIVKKEKVKLRFPLIIIMRKIKNFLSSKNNSEPKTVLK